MDPRPRLWTRDRDFGPATATLDSRPRHWTRDPRPATISQTQKTAISSEMKYIFYSSNTTHGWFRFKKRHGTRYLFDWLFPTLYRSSRYCFPSVCSPNVFSKKNSLIVSVLQTNSVFSRFLLLSSSFNSKLSVNPSWVKWCIFKTSQRSYSLERAQEVKFFPQWSGEGQKSVMSMSSDICNFCTFATGCQKFSNIR